MSVNRPSATAEAAVSQKAFEKAVVNDASTAVSTHDVVVIGMAWNPHVGKARKALDAAGVPYHYIGIGNYLSGWKPRLGVKMWSGWPTFPQVFVKGQLVGGNTDVRAAIESGELKKLLEA